MYCMYILMVFSYIPPPPPVPPPGYGVNFSGVAFPLRK